MHKKVKRRKNGWNGRTMGDGKFWEPRKERTKLEVTSRCSHRERSINSMLRQRLNWCMDHVEIENEHIGDCSIFTNRLKQVLLTMMLKRGGALVSHNGIGFSPIFKIPCNVASRIAETATTFCLTFQTQY